MNKTQWYYDPTIVHYGTPGMKWGRRKSQTGKRASEMSDTELAASVKRLQLEKTLKQLTSEGQSKSRFAAGASLVGKVLTDAGTKAATDYTNKLITAQLVKHLPIG